MEHPPNNKTKIREVIHIREIELTEFGETENLTIAKLHKFNPARFVLIGALGATAVFALIALVLILCRIDPAVFGRFMDILTSTFRRIVDA